VSPDADLLERFKPFLKYDSHEPYFADSAAEWTDNPDTSIATADGLASESVRSDLRAISRLAA
jgi:hypothetical protein